MPISYHATRRRGRAGQPETRRLYKTLPCRQSPETGRPHVRCDAGTRKCRMRVPLMRCPFDTPNIEMRPIRLNRRRQEQTP
jgi:hypothetical protein